MRHPFTTDLIANQSPLNGVSGRTKVAIIGFSEKVHHQAPWDDPEWEIWNLNMSNRMGFTHDQDGRYRSDRHFDLHPLSVQSQDDMAWIHCCPVPLYLTEPYLENPNVVVYPLSEVQAHYQEYCARPYFASSFAYMLALAMHEGYQTIGLFGCDLDWGRERMVEHGNLAFWVGLARGLGHTVMVPDGSAFLTHPARYGFDYHEEGLAVEDRMVRLMFELMKYPNVANRVNALHHRAALEGEDQIVQELWGHLIQTEDAPIVGQE